jgi:hypothetical protein
MDPHQPNQMLRPDQQVDLLLQTASFAVPFLSDQGQAFVCLALGAKGQQVFPLRSPAFRDWLVDSFYRQYEFPPDDRSLRKVLRTLQAQAFCRGERRPVRCRTAASQDPCGEPTLLLDLNNDQGEVVEITPGRWRVTDELDFAFRRGRGTLSLPKPIEPADPVEALNTLRALLNLSADRDWLRCLVWLLAALRPSGPYPILILKGPAGSGKSTLARLLRELVDPSTAPLFPPPLSERQLLANATHSWVLAFDHVSQLFWYISDALYRLSDGSSLLLRERYDEREALRPTLQRPVLLTLAHKRVNRWIPESDLATRALVVELPAISPQRRRTLAGIWRDFHNVQPAVLGALCTATSTALRRSDDIQLDRTPLLADVAAWAVAAAPVLGVGEQVILSALPAFP